MTESEEIIIAFQLGADDPNYADAFDRMRIHDQVASAIRRHVGPEATLVLAFISGMRSVSPHHHVEEIEPNPLFDMLEMIHEAIIEREKDK